MKKAIDTELLVNKVVKLEDALEDFLEDFTNRVTKLEIEWMNIKEEVKKIKSKIK